MTKLEARMVGLQLANASIRECGMETVLSLADAYANFLLEAVPPPEPPPEPIATREQVGVAAWTLSN